MSAPIAPHQTAADKTLVDAELARYLAQIEGIPDRLRSALEYTLLAPGKRVRPLLVLNAFRACGGLDPSPALPAAVAVEMIHSYSLIHDDLPAMDDDDMRRGRPSCHIQFGEALAILAGDALQAMAFEVLASGSLPADVLNQQVAILSNAAGPAFLVGGQVDDLAGMPDFADDHRCASAVEWLEKVNRRKTSALIAASVCLGGAAGGASAGQLRSLAEFGHAVGLAFQLTDDLLDESGEIEDIGKPVGSDRERGHITFALMLGMEETRKRVGETTQSAIKCLTEFGGSADGLRHMAEQLATRRK